MYMALETLPNSSVIDALRRNGFKATPQRIAICGFALGSREHPTAQRIYREVKKVHPTVSLATVYKTLQVLRQLHLVQELTFPESRSRFDSYMEPHLNIFCVQCGEVVDIKDHSTREIVARAAAKTKYTVTEQRFDIYGICEKCKGRRKLTSGKGIQ
jgi:Fur family peroxide stress response transcriptional regulator